MTYAAQASPPPPLHQPCAPCACSVHAHSSHSASRYGHLPAPPVYALPIQHHTYQQQHQSSLLSSVPPFLRSSTRSDVPPSFASTTSSSSSESQARLFLLPASPLVRAMLFVPRRQVSAELCATSTARVQITDTMAWSEGNLSVGNTISCTSTHAVRLHHTLSRTRHASPSHALSHTHTHAHALAAAHPVVALLQHCCSHISGSSAVASASSYPQRHPIAKAQPLNHNSCLANARDTRAFPRA